MPRTAVLLIRFVDASALVVCRLCWNMLIDKCAIVFGFRLIGFLLLLLSVSFSLGLSIIYGSVMLVLNSANLFRVVLLRTEWQP